MPRTKLGASQNVLHLFKFTVVPQGGFLHLQLGDSQRYLNGLRSLTGKFWKFLPHEVKNIILYAVTLTPGDTGSMQGQIEMNIGQLRKLKISVRG